MNYVDCFISGCKGTHFFADIQINVWRRVRGEEWKGDVKLKVATGVRWQLSERAYVFQTPN